MRRFVEVASAHMLDISRMKEVYLSLAAESADKVRNIVIGIYAERACAERKSVIRRIDKL